MVDRGHFVLHSYVKPQVTAGRYQLHATQPGSGVTIEAHDGEVYVSSPRYVMPPDQILSTFPPAMAQGDFGGRLPQIALKRRTIAWERRPDPSRPANEDPPVPWLALVVIAEGEGSISPSPKPVAECITPGLPPLPDPTDTDSATGFYLSVPDSVVKKVFPTIRDLPLLVHVREVDIRDTELASGDDDGWLAVVLANRLPLALPDKPVKYLACLVNLEGQLGVLPTTQVTDDFLTVTDAVANVFDSLAVVQHADKYATGTGTAALPTSASAVGSKAALVQTSKPLGSNAAVATTWATSASSTTAAAYTNASLAVADASQGVRLEMASGFAVGFEHVILERTHRFPVLAHWTFTSTNEGDFRSLMQALDVGLIGTQFGTVLDSTGEHPNTPDPGDPPRPPVPPVAATGHIELPQTTRRGNPALAWYRGPLSPHPIDRDPATVKPPHLSDQLRTTTPDGSEDVSLAAAFEIGRLLALSQPSLVSALTRWRRDQFGAARALALSKILAESTAFRLNDAVRRDLGRLLGTNIMTFAGGAPEKVVGPSRPLVDPGRPLELAGALERVVADGLGLDLDKLKQVAAERGPAYAFATEHPVVAGDEGLNGATLAGLRAVLDTELTKLTRTAMPDKVRRPGPESSRSRAESDALDAIIDRASDEAFDTYSDRDDRRGGAS